MLWLSLGYLPSNSAFSGSFFQWNALANSAGVSVRWELSASMAT